MRVTDLAAALAPECRQEIVGIRPGEKLHECLIPHDEARFTREFDDFYVILPARPFGPPASDPNLRRQHRPSGCGKFRIYQRYQRPLVGSRAALGNDRVTRTRPLSSSEVERIGPASLKIHLF